MGTKAGVETAKTAETSRTTLAATDVDPTAAETALSTVTNATNGFPGDQPERDIPIHILGYIVGEQALHAHDPA